jgi:hypothetical protein
MKLVLGFVLFLQFAFGIEFTYPDFKQCFEKNKNSFVYFGDIRAVAISKHTAIAYSKTKPTVAYIKHDPFLNLYLFESKKTLHPVRLKNTYDLKVGEWIAGMDESSLFAGNFAKAGDVFDTFYLQNAKIDANSIVSCLCCDMYGLGVGEGSFIGSEYIKRFINSKSVFYGDIGARFIQRGQEFIVENIDPFYEKQNLKVGDKVLKIDGNKIYSLKGLTQKVLFSNLGKKLKLEVLRDTKTLTVESVVVQKDGGGSLNDSFLEKKGIFLDADMRIKHINKDSFGYINGLKVGDKLLQVNHTKIENIQQLRKFFTAIQDNSVNILFDRNDFQFFTKLDIK